MKICILTTLGEWDTSYSLISVIESQLTALVKHGYETVLITLDNFDHEIPGVEVRKIMPRFVLEDYADNHAISPDFEKQVKEIHDSLKKGLEDIDIVIEHDLIFQGWFLPYCVAIHQLAQETSIKWFHWIHSVPNLMIQGTQYPHTLRYTLPKNSKLVYLNNAHIVRAAESYSIFPKDVRVVYNAMDPRLFWDLDPITTSLIDKYPILEADFIQVYPVSTPRMVDGKQIDILIEIFAQLKKEGYKICLIVPNAHANAPEEKKKVQDLLVQSATLGITPGELIFTSLESPELELGVPRKVVSQLFQLSNLFIFPSRSENCSLILLEAMLSKCLLVMNKNVPPLREFAKENALYFEFGGLDETVNYQDREKYLHDVALHIVSEFQNNKALKASRDIRQQFNMDNILKKFIEPLFYD